MAGIWNRIQSSIGGDRLGVHLIEAAFVTFNAGFFTSQQVINGLNATLATPLAGAELTDLGNIQTQLTNASGTANKLAYLERIKAATILGERGLINEATFRTILGIS